MAHERAKKGKMSRYEVLDFEFNLENYIVNLVEKIRNNQYRLGQYREFKIYEPKERIIKALPYIDRVVHQWYIHEFIKPYIVPKLIKDTYACFDGRGTHKAVAMVQKYMRIMKRENKEYYILKMDIKKFFYNIDHEILMNILIKYIKDKKLLAFTALMIFNDNEKIGIPIGNYTSQYFANIYLNELDQFIKHEFKIKYYVRYMDDFVLLVKDKETAKVVYDKIKLFLENKLKLSLNHKSRYYPSALGVNFCGYRIWSTHRLVRTRCKQKIKKKIKNWDKLNKEGKLDRKHIVLSFNSWLGHVKHANSYNLVKKIKRKLLL